MKKIFITILFLLEFIVSYGQVGINTTSPNAQFDINASNPVSPSNLDGILIPRVTTFPAINPTILQHGMLVFLTTVSGLNQPGFYYWNNPTSSWIGISSSGNGWSITGN